jgi:hypothetical protein
MNIRETFVFKTLNWCRNDNVTFRQLETIKEAHVFLIGYSAACNDFNIAGCSCNIVDESNWISDFMIFCEKELLAELKKTEPNRKSIDNSYANYIWKNQLDERDGLNKFYKLLDIFIDRNEA